MPKVLVVISTTEVGKALAGIRWATAAVKNNWAEDVTVVFYGPIQRLIAEGDERIIKAMAEYSAVKGRPLACKRVAEEEGLEEKLKERVELVRVGALIGEYLNKGYIPMVF